MALDKLGLEMIAPWVSGRTILCLGYPDITARPEQVEALLKVKPRKFTNYGSAHKISWPLPETIDTLMLAGATEVRCVDFMPSRGVETQLDLNVPDISWSHSYGVVINPGTIEHCFDIKEAMFNAWDALMPSGVMLSAAPLSMGNHGFYNIQPTFFADFAMANGGEVLRMEARGKNWESVSVTQRGRFAPPPESVLYNLLRKKTDARGPWKIPTQGRFL